MKFSTITKRRGLFNLNLCSAFESECYSVFYDETILFDNEIYLHNEIVLLRRKSEKPYDTRVFAKGKSTIVAIPMVS